ncbi:MAG: DUF58 domain-containing protein [Fimbriimonadaceae bacterium]|nr:MAG: DUF58 domain-containing protein [Fimbriimonadaceae bacterium]
MSWAAVFLLVMAVLVYSPMLFYMATAMIVTISAARLQAWLAVRYLRFERYAPPAVKVGEQVTVEIVVWSERELKRPLITIRDHLPSRLIVKNRTHSLPVAPSYDQPIRTKYSFIPTRRGRYTWERLTAIGTDALGLVSLEKSYHTDIVELEVYPTPLPVNAEIRPLLGWGASDLDSGRTHGSGLDPKGIREFSFGDPIRYIHWRSTAKTGKVMVKEFETGSGVSMNFLLQRTEGTDYGSEETSTFEAMCSHALYLATDYAKKGAIVVFPIQESVERAMSEHPEARERTVRSLLTDIMPTAKETLSDDLYSLRGKLREGETVVLLIAEQDSALADTITGWPGVQFVVMVYDPAEYIAGKQIRSPKSASEPSYIDTLERAGARIILMPRKEQVS